MKFPDNPTYRFWVYNIFFWTVFFILSILKSPPFLAWSFPFRFLLAAVFMAWALLFTGLYRAVYYRFKFENLSQLMTVFQIILSAIILVQLDLFARYKINHWIGLFDFMYDETKINNATGPLAGMYQAGSSKNTVIDPILKNSILAFTEATRQFVQIFKFSAYAIWTIGFNAYTYSQRLRQKEIEKNTADNRAKDLELINLRSQLNPHFLFNALNSIHSLAMMKKDTASDAVLLLSDLMRYTLNYEKRDLVPLSEEIEVVEKYLQLEKIRFGKKLTSELAISEHTLAIKIPPISVQTLVENAIKHGLKTSPNGVFIKIESHLNTDFLTINIINSGQLTKEDPSVNHVKNSGIGVENTRRRLQMIYGEKASFSLKNLNEMEVIATLELPIL
jgi:sensor histidine kinase YesM